MSGSDYFPVHAHSEYSWLDGMGQVSDMVATVERHGQPGLALTDHGVMAGVIRLYKLCRKAGIEPFPGEEFYLVKDVTDDEGKNDRFHVGMLALDQIGFEALIKLSSLSHKRERFHRKPLIDFSDLHAMADAGVTEHIALTSGCYFGLPVQMYVRHGYDRMLGALKMYQRFFPHTFVELQRHDADEANDVGEDEISEQLLLAADELGLPVVAGQDSHYCEVHHQAAHDLMKNICYFGDGEDFSFPGGPYHLASTNFVRYSFDPEEWERIEEGHSALLDLSKLKLPELDNYHFHVPEVHAHADKKLKQMVMDQLAPPIDSYEAAALKELDVIKTMGFANYFLIVEDITSFCRSQGIVINVRGSANGSLVCYLLKITNVDPLLWDTDFSRFLSVDRMKPPDIDIDVESRYRGVVIDYIKSKHAGMVNIGTYSRLGGEGETIEDAKGSVVVQYMAAHRRKDPQFDGKIAPEHFPLLDTLTEVNVRKAPGCHAAGLVLPSADLPIDKYLATMLIASSNTTVTQAVMEDVEDAGYVKLDLLGSKALETMGECLGLLGKPRDDWAWIPLDDKQSCKLLSSGKGVGLFQFEGYSTAMGGKEMRINNTLDAVLCMALYRPALMKGGFKDEYLKRRREGEDLTIHPVFSKALSWTYGVPIYQEQVIGCMRAVGLNERMLNDFLKAVKASNDKITDYAERIVSETEPVFLGLCRDAGLTAKEARASWQLVTGFSDYGFNRAHATSYGLMAYYSAYLKVHHEVEYMTALLSTWAGNEKEPLYVAEARRLGIKIVKPDVNNSYARWNIDHTELKPRIRRGLLSIKGIGQSACDAIVEARESDGRGPFTSIEDFIDRVPARPVSGGKAWIKDRSLIGVVGKLYDAGALRSIDQP